MSPTRPLAAATIAVALAGYACVNSGTQIMHDDPTSLGTSVLSTDPPSSTPQPQPPPVSESWPARPQKPLPTTDLQKKTDAAVEHWFSSHPTQRAYLQLDKPLYQPGETIWFRAHLRNTRDLQAVPGAGVTMQLVSPKGAVVAQKRVLVQDGAGANDFILPEEAQGGEYILQLLGDDGTGAKHPLIVASYEAPRLKKTLELLRKAYSPGDEVTAAVAVARGTDEPLANRPLTAIVTVDDQEVVRKTITTDAAGKALVKFQLPAQIAREDGLLTVLADDGGVVESIAKRIPITLATVRLDLYPEGGDLIEGLPGRVYFAATNTIGKPADVAGWVRDDQGHPVASFESLHDGLGRFTLTPAAGRTYHVALDKPSGAKQQFALPQVHKQGCSLMSMDDYTSHDEMLRVVVWCSRSQTVLVEAVLRERRLGSAAYQVTAGQPTQIALPSPASEQGAVRVTLFDEASNPLAERLIYRGRRADLKIAIQADKKRYAPRDPVTLTLTTTDLAGKPVQASLGLAVVDDTVLSFADDKTANLLARLYLEPELGSDPIEEPNFYFSDKPAAAESMDLLMGTRGWRRFEWQPVFHPPLQSTRYPGAGPRGHVLAEAAPAQAMPPAPPPAEPAKKPALARQAPPKPQAARARADQPVQVARERRLARNKDKQLPARDIAAGGGLAAGARPVDGLVRDEDWGGDVDGDGNWNYVPVRVFPTPTYQPGYDGPRTDFRETIYWAHDVRTGTDGTARVTFFVSDAVTSFRAIAEGTSAGGLPGRGEQVVQSKLPVSLDVRMPLEVSQGDAVQLPITLTNETDRALEADVQASFGAAFKPGPRPWSGPIRLGAGEKRALYYPLQVVGNDGAGEVQIALHTQGLKDELHKSIRVVPLGFPFETGFSGTVDRVVRKEIDLTGAMPDTIQAKVLLYPSPLASMTQGLAALVREPGGCFEQTSATNYPNIMVMDYLQENDAADPALVADAAAKLGRGYKLLTGYETREKGYEWFGESPGHEALTAYGLMEFKDMTAVWGNVDRSMIERTADWLMSRRDGKGGYQRNSRALDTFGRANDDTTALYITWALSEAGRAKGLTAELERSAKLGMASTDPYLVALAANTRLNQDPGGMETRKIVARLAGMQRQAGDFPGAAQSITLSGGESLGIETTALAALALVKASSHGEYEPQLRNAVAWINAHRGGYGEWGNTQGTVLALKALSAYARHSRQTRAPGVARVRVNGQDMGQIAFDKGRREALEFNDLAKALRPGKNVVEIQLDSQAALPYSVAIEYRSARPQSSAAAPIQIVTSLARHQVALGESVKLHATITNPRAQGLPMTLARVGLPGGLTFQTWQLKELRDKKRIGFYETRQREVILYLRDMKPGQTVDVALDLMATVPGSYVGPASSAYLYYTDEDKRWSDPLRVTVSR